MGPRGPGERKIRGALWVGERGTKRAKGRGVKWAKWAKWAKGRGVKWAEAGEKCSSCVLTGSNLIPITFITGFYVSQVRN
jgi:hypothetical protein